MFNKNYLTDPSGIALAYWEKHGRDIAPNGSVMRTTPIGVINIDKTENETFQAAIKMGAVTHVDPRCAISVAIVSALVRGLCRGELKTEVQLDAVLESAWSHVTENFPDYPLDRAEFHKHVHAESLNALVLCDRTMGYVYKCLGSGLWCLRQVLRGTEDFESALTKLTMCGGDADTNGAVAGALMGAACGYDALPVHWRDGMRHKDWYLEKIKAMFIVAGLDKGTYIAQSDSDTELDGGKGFLSEAQLKKREMEIMERLILVDQKRREKAEKGTKEKKPWKLW